MDKDSFIVGVADDIKAIHNSVESIIRKRYRQCVLIHFFTTASVKSFLTDNPCGLDILLLDVYFGLVGETGIEALPEIRDSSPGLPIVLFTSESNPSLICEAIPYNVEYLQKPVVENSLIIQVEMAIRQMKQFADLAARIQTLTIENATSGSDATLKRLQNYEKGIQSIIETVFTDVTFSPKAISKITSEDPRIFRVIKAIDWKMPGYQNNMQPKKFREMEDTWEYRFSKKGRVFVKFVTNEKPLIVDIDYNHSHDG